MKFWKWPRLIRGNNAPVRLERRSRTTILAFEVLEGRVALSTTSLSASWRAQKFSIENITVASSSTIMPGPVQTQGASPVQGEGFGQDISLDQAMANYPYRGQGYSVALIDTGIDYNNAALGGGWGKRVIAGYNFVNNSSDPMDDNGHGTHVAGIIGSSDPTYTGIAPDVNFIALKVLDATGSGTYGAVDQALQWVAAHQAQYHIIAVNMSLGSGNFTVNPYPYLESDFTTLKNDGVFMAVASGNNFYGSNSQQGLAYPAISPLVVSVGAVWDGNFGAVSWVSGARDNSTAIDQITSFTQRSAGLDILAPGAMITSTYLHNTFEQMAGTSMASPVVAGAAVLLHQALVAHGDSAHANEDYILGLMKSTGAIIVDANTTADNVTNTGLSFKRLNLFAGLNAVSPVNNTPPTLAPIANQTMTAGLPLTVMLSASSAVGDPLTFTAQATGNNNSRIYQLGQQLGLSYGGSYFLNSIGQNEKWLLGTANQWYCILPNGELRKWMGDPATTLAAGALITTLATSVYQDPTQLWTAPTAALPITFSFADKQLTVQSDPNYLGSFTVVVTANDGGQKASQTFTITINHRAPTLADVANQTMAHGLRTLSVSLNVSNSDNDALVYSAQVLPPSQQAFNLEQSLGLAYTGSYWLNYWGQQEKWLQGTANSAGPVWYCLLPNGELRRAGTSSATMLAASALVATLDSSFYQDPSLLWNAQRPVTAPVTFNFTGSQIVITPAASVVGTFTVQLTMSDGALGYTTQKTFTVTVTDSAPVLGSLVGQTVVHGKSLTLGLAVTDVDGDQVSWAAQTVSPSQQALSLQQTLGLTYTGSYWTNYYGQGEKWLQGSTGGSQWYCLLPNGELRHASTSAAGMLAAASLVGTLDANYYLDPSLLWNAGNYVVPQVSYTITGNQLTVTPAANFVGTFLVEENATDGALAAKQTFQVNVTETAPTLGTLASQTLAHNQGSLTVSVAAGNPDGAALTYAAQALSASQLAVSLKQTLGLAYTGNYWTNFYGDQEKWLRGQNGQWYCLLPNGELRLAGSSAATMLSSTSLVATLDSSFYQDPSLLWNAQAVTAAPVTVTMVGNQLTVRPTAGFMGTFNVQVTVSDGITSVRQSFLVTAL